MTIVGCTLQKIQRNSFPRRFNTKDEKIKKVVDQDSVSCVTRAPVRLSECRTVYVRTFKVTEMLKVGLGHLQCYRHPRLLQVLHGPEESPEALAFASEQVVGSLANVLA